MEKDSEKKPCRAVMLPEMVKIVCPDGLVRNTKVTDINGVDLPFPVRKLSFELDAAEGLNGLARVAIETDMLSVDVNAKARYFVMYEGEMREVLGFVIGESKAEIPVSDANNEIGA